MAKLSCNVHVIQPLKRKKKKHLYARDPQMFLSVINMDMSEYHKLSECYDWVKVLHSIMHYEKHSLNSQLFSKEGRQTDELQHRRNQHQQLHTSQNTCIGYYTNIGSSLINWHWVLLYLLQMECLLLSKRTKEQIQIRD